MSLMNLGLDSLMQPYRQVSIQTQQKRQNNVYKCYSNVSIHEFEQVFTRQNLHVLQNRFRLNFLKRCHGNFWSLIYPSAALCWVLKKENFYFSKSFQTNYLLQSLKINVLLETILRHKSIYPTGSYMFKVKNRNTRTRCGIC